MDWQVWAIVIGALAASAALVQAATAVVIVRLTHRLADLASGSLEQSQQQVKAAVEATGQMQLQGQLASTPMLRLAWPQPNLDENGELFTVIEIGNASDQPALAVEVRIYGTSSQRKPTGPARATSIQVPVLPAGAKESLRLLSRDIKQVSNPANASRQREPTLDDYGHPIVQPDRLVYAQDWLWVVAAWRSMLGTHVEIAYEWAANNASYEHGWRLRSVSLQPRPDHEAEINFEVD